MVPAAHDERRKRQRLGNESDNMFSIFRRTFYSSSGSSSSSSDNNNTSSDNELREPVDTAIDMDSSDDELQRVTATGVHDHSNDVFVRVARTAMATANVVFFPGDVQDVSNAMLSGPYAEYEAFSYEHTAQLLANKFGDDANVWIVRPSRVQFGAFTCFDNFVETNKYGAATSYLASGSAVEHLVSLMEHARSALQQQSQVEVSTLLPVHLVGFSKGGVVLNQIVTEVAHRWHPSQLDELDHQQQHDNNNNNNNNEPDDQGNQRTTATSLADGSSYRQFAALISTIHWLDSGNGSQKGVVPTEEATLAALSSMWALQLFVHVTPYQFDAKERPWIKKEVLQFVAMVQRLGGNVRLQRYQEDLHHGGGSGGESSLLSHFQLLRDFQLAPLHASSSKTGQSPSPEVTVQPFLIQTHM